MMLANNLKKCLRSLKTTIGNSNYDRLIQLSQFLEKKNLVDHNPSLINISKHNQDHIISLVKKSVAVTDVLTAHELFIFYISLLIHDVSMSSLTQSELSDKKTLRIITNKIKNKEKINKIACIKYSPGNSIIEKIKLTVNIKKRHCLSLLSFLRDFKYDLNKIIDIESLNYAVYTAIAHSSYFSEYDKIIDTYNIRFRLLVGLLRILDSIDREKERFSEKEYQSFLNDLKEIDYFKKSSKDFDFKLFNYYIEKKNQFNKITVKPIKNELKISDLTKKSIKRFLDLIYMNSILKTEFEKEKNTFNVIIRKNKNLEISPITNDEFFNIGIEKISKKLRTGKNLISEYGYDIKKIIL
ncbi:hypothetical protein GF327_10190 [Candidatus Woesearchaeota archaeon]|nr:hypothetical protein [Candidatus Woesearchaeota archaeon]